LCIFLPQCETTGGQEVCLQQIPQAVGLALKRTRKQFMFATKQNYPTQRVSKARQAILL